ncbi:MAG: DNA repair protein RecN [Clostridia bacterium]|nr:DNA repair protein RecN [Clostridia bacterium]
MLRQLYVSDLALIRRLTVETGEGFSVLTGGTGAGKSLILDSIGLFLSTASAKTLVRHGEEKLEVSLYFDELSPAAREALGPYLSPEELEEGVLLSRTVRADGKSTCRVGGRLMPFSTVRAVARELVSIHGQSEQGGLMDAARHRAYLDDALSPEEKETLSRYGTLYEEYRALKGKIAQMRAESGDEKEKIALYEFQMKEIARAKPSRGEEEELEARLSALENTAARYDALATADRALSGGEKGKGALYLLRAAARKLENGSETEKALSGELYELLSRGEEISRSVGGALSELSETDPREEGRSLRERLDLLYRLKQKYGRTVDEIIDLYAELKEKRDLTISRKDDIKKGLEKLSSLEADLSREATLLHGARCRVADRLEREIGAVLAFLDMPKMRFTVKLLPLAEFGPHGLDSVEFFISANTGEGEKPLAQVASGGELSRIMLALQLKLLRGKDADTLIFDEIDTGVSGSTAQRIGICLRSLAKTKQVFCVTHSPQVATLAHRHYLVEKAETDGRTETTLTLLSPEESDRETARLLGGRQLTDEALQAARTLREEGLKECSKMKETFQ